MRHLHGATHGSDYLLLAISEGLLETRYSKNVRLLEQRDSITLMPRTCLKGNAREQVRFTAYGFSYLN